MKYVVLYLSLICSMMISCKKEDSNIKYVDLFIATANDRGQLSPSATVPYGMVKVGPDNSPKSHVGYNYSIEKLGGFSINRAEGVGCSGTGGNISVRPALKETTLNIVKESEQAIPGYYSTRLSNGIMAEMTASNRVAVERYQLLEDDKKQEFYIDFSSSYANFLDCSYETLSTTEIVGWVSARNTCNIGEYKYYFYLHLDKEMDELLERTSRSISFSVDSDEVEMRIAISPISESEAMRNYEEIKKCSFEDIRSQAYRQWEDKLKVVDVEGGSEDDKKLFYSMLYRCFLSPVDVTSIDGLFVNSKGEIEKANDFTYYSSWSLWDTYRTRFPLLTILDPDHLSDMCKSLVRLYNTGKEDWSTSFEAVPTTRTEHASIILLDAYRKGIDGVELDVCYNEIKAEVDDNIGVKSPDGYLEYAYDCWALSEIAKELGKDADHQKYLELTETTWKTIWREKFRDINPQTFDVMHGDGLYEGTLWQYRWAVPFDIDGLCCEAGGKDVLKEQLDYFFENELYNHGNQPDIHAAYIYNRIGFPNETYKLVNKILTEPMKHWYGTHNKHKNPHYTKTYTASPDGFIPEMDDDDGTMSAWYVLSSMGLYPLTPGLAEYELIPSIFEKVTINTLNGKKLVITKDPELSIEQPVKASVNSKTAKSLLKIKHEDIISGITINFEN